MAVKLSANYSKKIGLPQYSSHSFMASVEIELNDLSQVESECRRLYALLQQSVDRELQSIGYLPGANGSKTSSPRSSHSNGARNGHSNGNGHGGFNVNSNGHPVSADRCLCTEGQRGLILRLINDNQLDKQQVEALSAQLFGVGVKQLNKMQASQLIDELLAQVGKPRQSRWRQAEAAAS